MRLDPFFFHPYINMVLKKGRFKRKLEDIDELIKKKKDEKSLDDEELEHNKF